MEEEYTFLKNTLITESVLTIPTLDDFLILQTDTSDVGLGAVLSVTREGGDRPVAYYSRNYRKRIPSNSASHSAL